jgi:hypothetical protein
MITGSDSVVLQKRVRVKESRKSRGDLIVNPA